MTRRQIGFLTLVNEFDASECAGRMIETFESQHRSPSLFDSAVVLVNRVVEITVRPHHESGWQQLLFLQLRHSFMRGGIAI